MSRESSSMAAIQVYNVLDPLVELLRPIPPTAWVAISLLLFGLGLQQKVFVVFVGTISPMRTGSSGWTS